MENQGKQQETYMMLSLKALFNFIKIKEKKAEDWFVLAGFLPGLLIWLLVLIVIFPVFIEVIKLFV